MPFAALVPIALVLSARAAVALMIIPGDLAGFTAASAHIVRARCVEAVAVVVEVAGARLAATAYQFEVIDTLKGTSGKRLVFRQVGTASAGPRDLGRIAGLPVYSPGVEYLLFLLPESAAGLTSPAGAGQGAFEVAGDVVTPLVAGAAQLTSTTPQLRASAQGGKPRLSYSELRGAVVAIVTARGAAPE